MVRELIGAKNPGELRALAATRNTQTLLAELLALTTEARDASVAVARELVPESTPRQEST